MNSNSTSFQLVKLLVATNLFLFFITGYKYIENNTLGTLELNKNVSETNPLTGVSFFYTLQYRCASTVDDCIGTVITDPLPPEVEFIGLTGSPHTINEVYNSGTHTVTFTFQNNLSAGSTGEVQVEVIYPNGVTPNGTMATNTATIDATNAASVSSSVSNTAFAEAVFELDKYFSSGGGVGGLMTYGFRVCNTNYTGNSTEGKLNIENIYVRDTLPAGAVLVETRLSGGSVISYDPVENIIVFSVSDLDVNECKWPRLTVQYSDPPYDGSSSVTNTGYVFGTPIGESEITDSDALTHGFTAPNPQVIGWKDVSHSSLIQGAIGSYNLDFEIDGTEELEDFCLVDNIPSGIEIQQIYHGGYYYGGVSAGDNIVTISYTTNLNGPQVITGSPFNREIGNGTYISVENDLGLTPGGAEYITSISWCYGDMPTGFGIYDDIILQFQVRMDAPVGIATNCMQFTTSTTSPTPNLIQDCEDLDVLENTSGIIAYPWKRVMNLPVSGRFNPGDTVEFNLTMQNPSSSNAPLTDPELFDLLPDELSYVPGSWEIPSWSQTLATSPIFTETSNYNGTGRTLLAWSWTGVASSQIEIGRETNIEFKAVISDDVLAGKDVFYNRYAFSADNINTCWGYQDADAYDINNNTNTSEILCFDSVRISINGLVSLESEKLVKGQLDENYTKFPDVAHSVPGGIADYILEVRNLGNIAIDSVVVIDIFPSPGDIGVIDTGVRDSRWQPNLVSTINAPVGVTVYYSTEGNPCRSDEGFVGTGPVGCGVPSWSTTPPIDLTTVRSVKFDFGSTLLQPQDTIQLSWAMRVPVNIFTTIGAQPDSIAWNSFGFIGRRTDNGQYILPSEPVKVGIDVDNVVPNVYGDFVWEDTNQNGLQSGSEPGIDGVRVELFRDDGDGIVNPIADEFVNFTLTANGGYYLFPNLDDGDYFSVFYKPSAMDITINDAGGNDANDSDGLASTYNGFDVAISPMVTLDNFAYDLNWDLGLYPSTTGAVGDYVWNDVNGNGTQDEANSEGINGVTINLYNNSSPSSPVASVVTSNDANGNPGYYLFSGITPGNYFLELNIPSGVSYTPQGATGTSDPSDSDFNVTTNRSEVFVITAGSYDNSWDAGLVLTGPEICDNGVDDDGDGLADYLDPECSDLTTCCDGENLIRNGSFENGSYSTNASVVDPSNAMTSSSFGGLPIDDYDADRNIFWIEDATRATDGNRFIYLPEGDVQGKCVYQREALYGGDLTACASYQITFDIAGFDENGTNPHTGYVIEFFYKNADGSVEQEMVQDEFVYECSVTPAPNPILSSDWNNLNWTRVSGTIDLPAPNSSAYTNIELLISINYGGGALIDNVCVNKISENVSIVATSTNPTCSSDGSIQVNSTSSGDRYEYNTTGFDNLPLTYASASNTISGFPQTVVNNIPASDPTTTYFVRVYESGDCFKDTSIVINNIVCTEICSDGIDNDGDSLIDEGCGSIAGTVFEDINYGGGNGRTYTEANTSATASGFANGAIRLSGVEVELYTNAGVFVSSTSTDANGAYSFSGLNMATYQVRVVNSTVESIRSTTSSGDTPIAVQTFKASASTSIRNEVGGADPSKEDADENSGSQTLSSLTSGSEVAQSVVSVNVTGNTTGSDFGFNFNTVVNTNNDGQGSLSQMIDNANRLENTNLDQEDVPLGSYPTLEKVAGWDHSIFMIPGAGPHTINKTSNYPRITEPNLHLTGYTQQGAVQGSNSGRVLQIELTRSNASYDLFRLEASEFEISGLSIYHTNRVVFAKYVVRTEIRIWGNDIGIRANGTVASQGNGDALSIYDFINVTVGTNGDGVNDENEGNIISNFENGVSINDCENVKIAGNWIGLDKSGVAAVANTDHGISFYTSTGDIVIGYDDRLAQTDASIMRNVIAGSGLYGIHLYETENVQISGNYIGLDATGMNPVPNEQGIAIYRESNNVLIGTDADGIRDAEERNVISGNLEEGVYIGYTGSNNNAVIAGNYIGTDVTGNTAVGNGLNGVESSWYNSNTRIGTNGDGVNDLAERNVISGNMENGVELDVIPVGIVAGNYIGVGADGVTPLGNGGNGVFITGTSTENIGVGCSPSFTNTNLSEVGNVIRNNTGAGIWITSGPSENNCLRGNSFGNNGGLAIDLYTIGVLRNDNGDGDGGPNGRMNMPIIESTTLAGNLLTVIGYTRPSSIVDFYIADAGPNPSPLPAGYITSFGEGVTLLGSFVEGSADDKDSSTGTYTEDGTGSTTNKTDNRFEFTFDVSGLGLALSDVVTAIATQSGAIANTSEFSGVTTIIQTEICNDGIDNDGDGLIDELCGDCSDCSSIGIYNGDVELNNSTGFSPMVTEVDGWLKSPSDQFEIWWTGFAPPDWGGDTFEAYSGQYSMELNGNFNATSYQIVDACPGESYSVVFAHMARSNSNTERIYFVVYDHESDPNPGSGIEVARDTSMQHYTTKTWLTNRFDFILPLSYSGGPLRIEFQSVGGTPGYGNLIDDVNLVLTCNLTEVCNDGIDNDYDGLVDCFDPDCPCYNPFSCGSNLYMAYSTGFNQPSTFSTFNTITDPFTLDVIGNVTYNVNAMGYRNQDNFIYGIELGTNELIGIDADGVGYNLGEVLGLPTPANNWEVYDAGDVFPDGYLYVHVTYAHEEMYQIDVTTSPAQLVAIHMLDQAIHLSDFAYNTLDDKLYGIGDNGTKYMIDPSTWAVSTVGTSTSAGSYGAAYTDDMGRVFIYNNSAGAVYRVDFGLNGTGTGDMTLVANAPQAYYNDGASCRGTINLPEVCDNGIDDDGDGFTDCEDPDCLGCTDLCGDFDSDGVGDYCDLDDDNDGVLDSRELRCDQPLVANSTSGTGSYQDQLYFFNWDGSDFDDGLQSGDNQTFILPDGLTITATFTNVTVTGGVVNTSSFDTWSGAFLKNLYQPSGGEEALYGDAATTNISATVTFVATKNGRTFPLDLLAMDAESTNSDNGILDPEGWQVTSNGEPWTSLEQYAGGGNWTGVNESTLNAIDTELSGGNTIFYSRNATTLVYDLVAPGTAQQAIAIGLYLICDTDDDGYPDHVDLDSDGDGCSDALEAGATADQVFNFQFPTSPVGTDGVPDEVQDVGQEDSGTINYVVSSDFQDASIQTCDCQYASGIDADGDGIDNWCDMDNDNDGILDTDEGCICEVFDISLLDGSTDALNDFNNAMMNVSGATIQIEDPLTFGGGATLDEFSINDEHETGSFGLHLGVNSLGVSDYLQSNYSFSQPVCNFNARLLDIDRSDALIVYGFLNGVEVGYTITSQGMCVAYDNANTFSSSCFVNSNPASGNTDDHAIDITFDSCIDSLTFRIYENGIGSGGSFTFVVSPIPSCSYLDTDGDGVPDCFDLDSDNDGCSDALEAGATTSVISDFQFPNSPVGSDGVPDAVQNGGQENSGTVNYVVNSSFQDSTIVCDCPYSSGLDSDSDGVDNTCDVDNDNDGILDVDEGCICETFDISSLDGSVDALNDFNNAMMNISGSTIQIEDPLTFGGAATLDEFSINNEHSTGSYGLQLGVNSSGPSDYLQSNYSFSQPVCGFNARLLDIDVSDALVVYGFLDGVEVAFNISYQGDCVSYDNVNTFSSVCLSNSSPGAGNVNDHSVEIGFDTCIDSLTFRIYENGVGSGGSFTFVISPDPTCSYLDTDGDGIADCFDTDSDDDGCVDAIEGGDNYNILDIDGNEMLSGGVDGDGLPLVTGGTSQTVGESTDPLMANGCQEVCDNGIDDDGDGLTDCEDPDCIDCTDTCEDLDGDGIGDFCDIDDDNDGIPDLVEYNCQPYLTGLASWSNNDTPYQQGNTSSSQISTVGNEVAGAGIVITESSTTLEINGIDELTLSRAIINNDYLEFSFTTEIGINAIPIATLGYVKNDFAPSGNYGYSISVAISDDNFASSDFLLIDHEITDFVNGNQQDIRVDTDSKFIFLAPNQLYRFRVYFYNKTTSGIARFDDFLIGGRECYFAVDVDNDGIFNHRDLDSDNDGIFDAYEAGHSEAIGSDGRIVNATTGSGVNGLFNVLETSSDNGILNYSVADSETSNDGIYDPYELDSDGDGCFDAQEAGVLDFENDGIAGTGIPTVNGDGLVTAITYTTPPNNNWQNPLIGACLSEICNDGIDNDADGNADCDDTDCALEANPATLNTCDNSNMTGSGIFILHDANPTVSSESGVSISYHPNLADAQNDVNILISPHTSSDATVYVRVERISTGCFATAPITLNVGTKCVESCVNGVDDDGDGLIDCADPDCPCCSND